jgi:hypothetical protein
VCVSRLFVRYAQAGLGRWGGLYEQYYLFGRTGCRRCGRPFVLRVALIRALSVLGQKQTCFRFLIHRSKGQVMGNSLALQSLCCEALADGPACRILYRLSRPALWRHRFPHVDCAMSCGDSKRDCVCVGSNNVLCVAGLMLRSR